MKLEWENIESRNPTVGEKSNIWVDLDETRFESMDFNWLRIER
jgi:hypothetical protein